MEAKNSEIKFFMRIMVLQGPHIYNTPFEGRFNPPADNHVEVEFHEGGW